MVLDYCEIDNEIYANYLGCLQERIKSVKKEVLKESNFLKWLEDTDKEHSVCTLFKKNIKHLAKLLLIPITHETINYALLISYKCLYMHRNIMNNEALWLIIDVITSNVFMSILENKHAFF
jgi:hypothetical protein